VANLNATANTFNVLGQTVVVSSSTVFSEGLVGGFAALKAGAVVEVHGIANATTGQTVATRIEAKPAAPFYRLRGLLSALDSNAKTFKIGSELISYASLAPADVPAGLANGQTVQTRLNTVPVAGAWVATRVGNGVRKPEGALRDAHLEGVVTAFTSSSVFEVNGLKVSAANASFPDGAAGVLLGARVEVDGAVVDGVLVATRVEIKDKRDGGQREIELNGDVAAINTSAKTFTVRAVTVAYSGTVSYKNGSEADLAVGKRVQVKGVLSADRTQLQARSISFK
jgi:Domain of unknown function (DUF5666)